MLSYSKNLDYNIIQIDTGYLRQGLAACYLVIDSGRVAVIDTGVEHTALRVRGSAPTNRDFRLTTLISLYPTHVHLDHAGGAGKLMQICHNASLVIHPFGSRHMIDPSRLIAGAEAVYGKEGLHQSVGEIIPVDRDTSYRGSRCLSIHAGEQRITGHRYTRPCTASFLYLG